jgi:DNA-binding NarL/FixJ family response regulator
MTILRRAASLSPFPMPVRVGAADDQLLVREAVSELLEGAQGIDLVVVCSDADSMRAAVAEHALDVIVVGIRMGPDMTDDGIRLAMELRRTHPRTGVVVLTAYCEPSYALALLEGGSDGRAYLLKDRLYDRAQLVDAIRRVAQGGSVIDPKVVEVLVDSGSRPALDSLSPREREILAHMSRGESNAGIAESLGLTTRNVEKHVNGVFAKLDLTVAPGASRRVHAVLRFLAEHPSDRLLDRHGRER